LKKAARSLFGGLERLVSTADDIPFVRAEPAECFLEG
jgi:hypothetical protein